MKIFFLVNKLAEFDFADLIEKHLIGHSVTVGNDLPFRSEDFDLVVLWSYRKKILVPDGQRNIVLFHSSSLPAGRGFSPIYNTIARGLDRYVVSGILVAPGIDEGDILVQASFAMRPEYIASDLRRWDAEISLILTRTLLERSVHTGLNGRKQTGVASWWPRRKPEDSEVDIKLPFERIISHLRACEERHPAFFMYDGVRYIVSVRPEISANFPADVQIVFPSDVSE